MGRLEDLAPGGVFRFFEEISAIPRGSGNEAAIASYCVDFAKERGLEVYRDGANNVIISKKASEGFEEAPGVILQGHLDMVCEKDADCRHDFLKDGLDLVVDGDYVFAKGTTLGGDDGAAVAMMLAVLDDAEAVHPSLECLFTTGEEVGLTGASALDAKRLRGRLLINIDSEEEGVFTVGCAGGGRSECRLKAEYDEVCGTVYRIRVDGLTGGHSGTEIDKGRGNADILMGRVLSYLGDGEDYRIAELSGGNFDNAIPGSAEALLYLTGAYEESFEEKLLRIDTVLKSEYATSDPGVRVDFEKKGYASGAALNSECTSRLVHLLYTVPDGVIRYSADVKGLVETSLNLGIMKLDGDEAVLVFCVRSSVDSQKEELQRKLKAMAEYLGGSYVEKGVYPGWKYRVDSRLRDTMVDVYRGMYGKEPEVLAIHAGLECGLFCGKLEDLDCVSIGPDILDIHTPKEKLSISSTKRVYEFILEVLKALCQ